MEGVLDSNGFFDRRAMRALAIAHRDAYAHATPFPHAVLDDFLPRDEAAHLARSFPGPDHPDFRHRSHREQNRFAQLGRSGFGRLDPRLHHLLNELNSMAFLDFLHALTGVRGIIGDPHYRGAGPLLATRGGHLAIHIDFDRDRSRGLTRVLTVLLYLTTEWDESWGGALELHPDGEGAVVHIAPKPNRLVVLAHGETHWHGHPVPIAGPDDARRQLVAAYFYAASPLDDDAPAHSAIWRA